MAMEIENNDEVLISENTQSSAMLESIKEMLPKLPAPATRDLALFLQSSAGPEFFSGNWPSWPVRWRSSPGQPSR